jgi:hypothetical protein
MQERKLRHLGGTVALHDEILSLSFHHGRVKVLELDHCGLR